MTKTITKDINKTNPRKRKAVARPLVCDTQTSPFSLPFKHTPLFHIGQHLGSFWHSTGNLLLSLQSAAVLIWENTSEFSNIIDPATKATIEKSNKSTGVKYFIYYMKN